MSILIKGIDLPKGDWYLDLVITADGVVRDYGDEDEQIAEAIELPDHGDLIDRDKLKHGFCVECTLYPNNCLGENCDWGSIYHIEHAHAVIPAERSEE